MRRILGCIIIILLCVLAAPVYSLPNYRFQHITEGLSHQQVEELAQDENGNLWIGTRNGLAKYNGYDIVTYFNDDNDEHSLPHNTIESIFIDSRQRIWIGTYNGICRYCPESDDFRRYSYNDNIAVSIIETKDGKIVCGAKGLYIYDEVADDFNQVPQEKSEYIIDLAVDDKNRIFCSTNNSIYYFDSTFTKKTQIATSVFSDFLTGYDGIIPLFFDSKGILWIGRNGKGVMSLNLDNGESCVYYSQQLSDGTVRSITEDDRHRIWLGTEKGITIIHPDGKIEILQQDFVNKNKLNDNAIYTILCDKDGNIWIGTYFGGINVLLRKTEQFSLVEPGYGINNMKGKAIRNIIEPQNGLLWIATEDGGLNIYNTHNNEVQRFDEIPTLGHNIHDIFYDEEKDLLWIGTYRNGLFRYDNKTKRWCQYLPSNTSGLMSDAIFSIKKQKNGKLWVATTFGMSFYDEAKDCFHTLGHPILDTDFIYCLLIDNNDNVWAGTRNNGLFRIDTTNDEIINWPMSQIKDQYVTCLYQDYDNLIWIGTNNNGLLYMNPDNLQPVYINLDSTLSQSTICSIIGDKSKQLWVGTSQGLYQLSLARNEIIRYTIEDGLPTNQFNFSSAIQANNGMYYFGSINGLISFDPMHIADKKKTYEVHLISLVIDNQNFTSKTPNTPLKGNIDDAVSITLSSSQSRSFYIEYGAISLGSTKSIKYQVRLLGLDKEWHDVCDERKFVGSNLSHGKYTLQIRANNSNVGWDGQPIKELQIIVEPPFYLSYYAYIVYILFIGILVFVGLRIINNRMRKKNEEKMELIEKEKLEELNTIKLDFFTMASHELKTPLSLIVAPLNYIAQNNQLTKDSKEKLDTVIKNTNKMTELIDELVTFNKVETGNFRFYIQQGNPLEFIENITYLFKENASTRQISLYTHCENNGEIVWFSPSFVEKILNNLLSNALKFTSDGGKVYVNAQIDNRPDGYTYLNITVKDTGIGIAKDELDNIFNKYYQTKRGYNKNSRGWGLGLSLVKQLATIHKGNVSVESTVGQGSTFVVSINVSDTAFDPRCKITADKTVVALNQYKFKKPILIDNDTTTTSGGKNNTQFSILIVEDDKELLQFLAELFSSKYNIYTAENGVDGLDIARNNPIDLVISDIMMPMMDGITLCRELKADIYTSHIPVILLTAKNDSTDILEGYQSGADIYVQKPFDYQILNLQIKNILREREKLQHKILKDDTQAIEESSLSKLDKEFIDHINELIDRNINNIDFSIADITSNLAISRSLLHIKMKNLLNTSAGDYIRKRRLNKACALLCDGYNVSETAFNTGFADPNYFSKAFKKELGMTPTEYINNYRKQNVPK